MHSNKNSRVLEGFDFHPLFLPIAAVVLECCRHLSLLRLVLLLQAWVFIAYWARLMLIWRIISVINLKNLGLCLWKVDPELWGNYPNWVEWVSTGLAHPSVHCATIGSLVPAVGAFHFHNHPCTVSAGPWALSWKHLSLKVAIFFLAWILTDRFPRFIENPDDNILNGSLRIAKHSGVLNSCFRNGFSDWRNRSIDMCIITVYQFNPLKWRKVCYKVARLS